MENLRKLSVISFTERGKSLSEVIRSRMEDTEVSLYTKHGGRQEQEDGKDVVFVESSVGQWAGEQMEQFLSGPAASGSGRWHLILRTSFGTVRCW
mgnify:CR=1 FL=1